MAGMIFDPELMQDFLTESGELLEQLDQDLVVLEGTPDDPELLNRVFRALHTIKGSASFLGLTHLVSVAHAAETCLNAARNRVFIVDRGVMDLLLNAIDLVKRQFEDIRNQRELTSPDAALCAKLTALGEGRALPEGGAAPTTPSAGATHDDHPIVDPPAHLSRAQDSSAGAGATTSVSANTSAIAPSAPIAEVVGERPLALPSHKADLTDFLIADLESCAQQLDDNLGALLDPARTGAVLGALGDVGENILKQGEFFEFDSMSRLARCVLGLSQHAPALNAQQLVHAQGLGQRVSAMLREQVQGLTRKVVLSRPMDDLCKAFDNADTLIDACTPTTTEAPPEVAGSAASAETDRASERSPDQTVDQSGAPQSAAAAAAPGAAGPAHNAAHAGGDNTIRVEVGRLESLLNLVGELVLQKNRVGAVTRQIGANEMGTQEFREMVGEVSNALERVTGDLQLAVMKTRMQPLEKVFGKYPRLVRDLARKLNKQITLEVSGGETEVDRSVIEEIGDPLVHLMRNACDHGIELPEARVKAGKSPNGTIHLSASNAGGHVEIRIADDGKGIDPVFITRKAIEKGLLTEAQGAALSDREKKMLIFAPGFSTAEKISDVSGRGVGMDVVKTNIEKLKGSIEIDSAAGAGTTILIKIPLTVAIMSAMMVGVGKEIYAVPLSSIVEIVKPEGSQRSSIRQQPVMRLRDSVLPLLDGCVAFRVPPDSREESPLAVVLGHASKRVGLLVTRVIGQQEVVIKPLDDFTDSGAPVSGATVRDDGCVSLIVDVPRLFELANDPASR
jgi:two-component system chemotaxis sensor kinase CheA